MIIFVADRKENKVGDNLLKKISAIRSDGNILPLPVMSVDRIEFDEGDILIVEVTESISNSIIHLMLPKIVSSLF